LIFHILLTSTLTPALLRTLLARTLTPLTAEVIVLIARTGA
jgi:hypothetical protein